MKLPNLFTIYKRMEDNLDMNKQINKLTIRTICCVGGFRVGLEKVKNNKSKK